MFVINLRKFFIGLSIFLIVASGLMVAKFGINFGIEFTGGSVLEVSYEDRPSLEDLKTALADSNFATSRVQLFGDNNALVRGADLTEEERVELLGVLAIEGQDPALERFNSIGPSIGKELRNKALIAMIVVLIAIILFVAYAFRRVSKPVSSWKYGLIAVIALIHDVIIPIGVFALLGREVNSLFAVGLLSILGLSVNDTIVVFDRIRENLAKNLKNSSKLPFPEVVGKSLRQTIARSINTSLTLFVVLIALFAFGPEATKDLALVLAIGTLTGTYSSIFFASPLLVSFNQKKN